MVIAVLEAIIISDMTQIPQLDKDERICLVAQTTFMRSAYNEIAEYLKKFQNVEIHDTICDTTKNRQEEAEALSKLCDCVIVIGGKTA